jgi:hypothetical protein
VGGAVAVRRLYGDLAWESGFASVSFSTAAGLDAHNFFVMARALLKGDFTFCSICDFNELGAAGRAPIATSGLCAWYQAVDDIDHPIFERPKRLSRFDRWKLFGPLVIYIDQR